MSNVPFATYTESGNELGSGMTEREALESAQRDANGRHETIDVYQGSRFVAAVEPEHDDSRSPAPQAAQDGWIETSLHGVSVLFEDGECVRVSQLEDSERTTQELDDHLRKHYAVRITDGMHGWSQATGEQVITAAVVPV